MSELPADSSVSQMGAVYGNCAEPQVEVSDQRQDPAPTRSGEAREGPMAAAWEDPVAAPREGPMAAAWEDPVAAPREGPMAAAWEDPVAAPREGPMAAARVDPMAAARDGPMAAAWENPMTAPREGPVAAPREGPMAAAREGPMAAAREGPMAAAREGPMAAAREGLMAAAEEGPVAAPREGRMAAAVREGRIAASRESLMAVAREARMAEVARLLAEPAEEEGPEGRPRSRSGNGPGLAALPYLRLRHPLSVLGINYQQFLRRYVENYPIALGRIRELEERRRRFVEACRAREAAFDAEYQRNPQRMDFDMLAFTVVLSASEVIDPLIEELGCDKFINRE